MPREPSRGLTLVELLVAVALVALLAAILVPATIRARDTARKAHCLSNLHNIGLALQHHENARGAYPSGAGPRSFLWKLLPFLGYDPLFKSKIDDRTAAVPIPGLFLCPSDTARSAFLSRYATSYAGNAGLLGREPVSNWEGAFTDVELTNRDMADGLSATAGVAEWIVGNGDVGRPSRLGSIFTLDLDFPDSEEGRVAFAQTCGAYRYVPTGGPVPVPFKGSYWFRGRLGHSLYTHALPPGRPSCRAVPDLNAITAGSFHGDGGHVLFLDGAVRYIREDVHPSIWSALGTRAGNEPIGNGSY